MSIANTWRWLPDWSSPITERLEWRTDVQQGYTGQEERYALRQIPRRSWSWQMVLDGYGRQKFETEFFSAATATWLVPLWWDVSRAWLVSGATSYTRSISPDDTELRYGGYLVVADRDGAIGKGPITITRAGSSSTYAWVGGLPRAFPRGRVYAARLAKVALTSCEHVTAGVTRYTVSAEAVEDYAVGAIPVEQWPLRPDRSEPLPGQWEILQDRVDFGGAWLYDVRRAKPLNGRELSYIFPDREKAFTLRLALAHLSGQYRQTLLPSFQSDLEVVEPIAGPFLMVRPIGWTTAMPTRVAIVTRSGDTLHRQVTGTFMVGGFEVLALSSAVTVTLENLRQVCWVATSRLATDAVEIIWTTPQVASVSLPWREVAI
jgi:hypothetical protein